MGYHKGDFHIHKADHTLEKVSGWIDDTNTYGFHKLIKPNGKVSKWVATDLKTGLRVCAGETRTECHNWIITNKELVELQREKPEYKKHMMWYRETRDNKA